MAAWLATAAQIAAAAPTAPVARLFDSVDHAERLDPRWRSRLCALLPQPCSDDSLRLFRPRGGARNSYMVLADQPLAMATVTRAGRAGAVRWRVQTLHDFSGYTHSMSASSAGLSPRVSLAPALYPLGAGKQAVAVLWSVSEMYSGGGGSFSTADFVPLEPALRAGAGREAVYPGIPFSCSKLIRACFSEAQYRSTKHCHDEIDGGLRIGYGAPTKALANSPARAGGKASREPSSWRFSWHEVEWPAFEPQSKRSIRNIRFGPTNTARVPFCGGPQ